MRPPLKSTSDLTAISTLKGQQLYLLSLFIQNHHRHYTKHNPVVCSVHGHHEFLMPHIALHIWMLHFKATLPIIKSFRHNPKIHFTSWLCSDSIKTRQIFNQAKALLLQCKKYLHYKILLSIQHFVSNAHFWTLKKTFKDQNLPSFTKTSFLPNLKEW